jgi:hypothetical protein
MTIFSVAVKVADPDPEPHYFGKLDPDQIKIEIYLFLSLYKERPSKPQKKPSALKREHSALQNLKFLPFFYFLGILLPSWIRIRVYPTKINPKP